MKKSFVKSALSLIAFMISASAVQAQTSSLVANISTSHAQHRLNTLQLTCLNKADKGVKISIADANGSVLFSERLNGLHSFRRTYDVSELAAGQYRLVVDNGTERTEKSIVF